MKLRRGRAAYKFPEHSQVLNVWIQGNQPHNQMFDYAIQLVSRSELEAISGRRLLGFPALACVSHGRIEFYPIPDHMYTARVRYVPPVKVY